MDWRRFSNPTATTPRFIDLYHGTTATFAQQVLRKGFRPRKRPLYLTDSLGVAEGYAADQAWEHDESQGVVLAVTVPAAALRPDDMAYLFLCFNETGKFVVTRRQLLATKKCRHAATGAESLRQIGSVVFSGAVGPGSVRIVKRVKAKRDPGIPSDPRALVRVAHRQG